MVAFDAVIGDDGDHAAAGEMFGMWLELIDGVYLRATAEEEDGSGGWGGRGCGFVDAEGEFPLWRLALDAAFGIGGGKG